MSADPQHLAEGAARRALFERLVRESQRTEPREPAIRPRPRVAPLPLSFQQQRQYILEQLGANSSFNVLCAAVRLKGPVDVAALRQAINQVVDRHEVLRSSFHNGAGGPEARIIAALDLPLLTIDLTVLDDPQPAVAAWERREAHRGFDLEAGPLVRASLARVAADEHVLTIAMHHMVADGVSISLVLRDLCASYEGAVTGRSTPLSSLPVQYVDYAWWQADTLRGDRLESGLAYWTRQLADLEVLQLPTDHPRPAVERHVGRRCTRLMPTSVSAGLQTLGRRQGVTMFMVTLAAFQALLARYAGQASVAVGSPIANRGHREIEELVGFFANILVLRTDMTGRPTCSALVRRVRDVVLDAHRHQDCPFEKVVEALQPRRTLSHAPLFQVWFALEAAPDVPVLSGLAVTVETIDLGTSRFDLALTVTQRAGDLALMFEYSADLFDDPTIDRMAGHLATMLSAVAANPEQVIWDLPIFTPVEQRAIVGVARSALPPDLATGLHERFASRAALAPDAVAVVCGDDRLTYGALEGRARRLAARLRRAGVGPQQPVALCTRRSVDLIAGMLGILNAAGAYVPLDPAVPRERLARMIADCGANVLVGHPDVAEPLAADDVCFVSLDAEPKHGERADADPLRRAPVHFDDLAYTIYTSGSTGIPKGVQVVHGAVVNLVDALHAELPFDASDVWTMCHSCGFDLSVWEVWAPLLSGGTLIVVPSDQAHDPDALWDLLRREQVTMVNQTPSALRLLVDAIPPADARRSALRVVMCGGEAFPKALAERVLEWQKPVCALYGPTEATVWTSVQAVGRGDLPKPTVLVGHAIAGNRLYLVDRHLQLAPVGARAELCIGGVGLARGYANRPEQTADRFVPDPFGDEPDARMYRTGDLARYTSDGRIEFLGRVDHQIKLRGYRIELGDVEAALRHHPDVRDALAMVRVGPSNEPQLVGYVVGDREASTTAQELRAVVKELLPEYMVPSAFVVVDGWPLSRSGKIDRAALPPPASTVDGTRESDAPRTQDELVIASLFSHVLGIPQVGVHDDFFELGGHSLLAPPLMARVRELFHVTLSARTLFEAPTVAELAARVKQALRADSVAPTSSPLVAALQIGSGRPFFCVHPGGGGVSCYRDLARMLGRHRTFYGLQAPELDPDAEAAETPQSIEAAAADYVAAMRIVQPLGPYLLGGWSAGGIIAFEMARRLHEDGDEVALLALIDSAAHFDPAARLDEGAVAFLFATHLADLAGKPFSLSFEQFCALPPDEQFGALLDALKMDNLLPRETRLAWFGRVLDGVRARAGHIARYVPGVYAGEITLFRAADRDAELVKAQTALDGSVVDEGTAGWAAWSGKPVIVCDVPGNHFNLMREPHVAVLAARLEERIQTVERAIVERSVA